MYVSVCGNSNYSVKRRRRRRKEGERTSLSLSLSLCPYLWSLSWFCCVAALQRLLTVPCLPYHRQFTHKNLPHPSHHHHPFSYRHGLPKPFSLLLLLSSTNMHCTPSPSPLSYLPTYNMQTLFSALPTTYLTCLLPSACLCLHFTGQDRDRMGDRMRW